MIALALKALGLMRVSEHGEIVDRVCDARDDAWAALKIERERVERAATDLAAQADLVSSYEAALGFSFDGPCPICGGIEGCSDSRAERIGAAISRAASHEYDALEAEIATLRPDAQKWRDYLKRSRDRKAGRKS